ncbi:MAG: dihydrofolate reductase family protein [Gammaproteobacteria bacterium]|nr:dihydrofolate reductase family protein [Gammaproteobacteria bacterium]
MKCSVFVATSLDGFIARKDGGLDWLSGDHAPGGEDYGYREFMATVDTLVMGRNTYEQVSTFNEWPYDGKQVIVLSHAFPNAPLQLRELTEGIACPPQELLDYLAARGDKHLYIDGGKTIQGFLRAGLIHEMTITRIPILLGGGIPLFGALDQDVRMLHLYTRAYENGFVQSRYQLMGVA